jgi:hypothetical protein
MGSASDDARSYYQSQVSQETKAVFGSVGISQAIGTDVAVISDIGSGGGRGWWKIWGHGRHTLADGLKLSIGPVAGPVVKFQIAAAANTTVYFGPYLVQIANDTDDIIVELAVATGGADSAAATLYAKRMADA